MSWGYYGWRPYVTVAKRRANASRELAKLQKKTGRAASPVVLDGRTIARTFWGKAWCDNLEAYSDFANRLPRGRTYVRNGSVVDLQIEKGVVTAQVSGSELYRIRIQIKPLTPKVWKSVQTECAGKIDSLIELLQGKLSSAVMQIVTRQNGGLFPAPKEIDLDCSCPDWADLCKHVAASLYGVGARLDQNPGLLFVLRGVDPADLISKASAAEAVRQTTPAEAPAMSASEISEVFGIELDQQPVSATPAVEVPTEPVPPAAPVQAPKPNRRTQKKTKANHRLSAAERAKIAARVRARWAKIEQQNGNGTLPRRPRKRATAKAKPRPGAVSAPRPHATGT